MAAGWSIARSSYQTTAGGNPTRIRPGGLRPVPWQQQANGWLTPEERHLVDNLGYLASNQPRGSDTDPAATGATRKAGPAGEHAFPQGVVLSSSLRNCHRRPDRQCGGVLLSMLWAITRPVGSALRSLSDQDGDLERGAIHQLVKEHSLALPGLIFLALGFAALMLWVLTGQFLVGPAEKHPWARVTLQTLKRAAYGGLALGALLALALWGFVELVGAVAYLSLPALIATAAAGAGVIGSVVRILRKPAARFAPMLGGFAFVVVALGLTALATWNAAEHGVSWSTHDLISWQSGWDWVVALVLVGIALVGPSPENWSLAPFYRCKLRLAYASYRARNEQDRVHPYLNDNLAGKDLAKREPGLFGFNRDNATVRTPLVVCTTSTVTSRAVRTHYGTPALSVPFDPDRTILHLPQDGRGRTPQFAASTRVVDRLGNRLRKRITTMMAVAISSAAVSPAMGRIRIGPTSMLLTFFNVRLGVWIATHDSSPSSKPPVCNTRPTCVTHTPVSAICSRSSSGSTISTTPASTRPTVGTERTPDSSSCSEWPRSPRSSASTRIPVRATRQARSARPSRSLPASATSASTSVSTPFGRRPAAPAFRRTRHARSTAGSSPRARDSSPTRLRSVFSGTPSPVWPGRCPRRCSHSTSYPRESTLNQFFDAASFVVYRNLRRYNGQVLLARQKLQGALTNLLAIDNPDVLVKRLSAMACDPTHLPSRSRIRPNRSGPAARCRRTWAR
jgi:hypothetical protein